MPLFLLLPLAVIALFIIIIGYLLETSAKKDMVPLQKERREIKERLREKKTGDVIDTIKLGLNELEEYYVINKSQAKLTFFASLFAIIIGFITLLFGIWVFYTMKFNVTLPLISSISGILLQFIGGAYFFMYKQSIEQVNYFFDQLVKEQDTMLAIKLAQELPNSDKQIEMTEKIISNLLERSLKSVPKRVNDAKAHNQTSEQKALIQNRNIGTTLPSRGNTHK